jgi:hypothetical protein
MALEEEFWLTEERLTFFVRGTGLLAFALIFLYAFLFNEELADNSKAVSAKPETAATKQATAKKSN